MYEINFILKEESAAAVKKVLAKNKAEIIKEQELEKIHLSYPIKKQNYGFLGVVKFEAARETIAALTLDLKLEANILRFLINQWEPKAISAEEEKKVAAGMVRPMKQEPLRRSFQKPDQPILTNEELEKKIEEILQ